MADPTRLGQVALPHHPASATEARRAVTSALREVGVADELVEVAALLTSELVTNAVLHGQAALELTVLADDTLVRIEVADGSPVLPRPRRAAADGTTGRGLQLVASLASRWGSEPLASPTVRKVVWVELDRTTAGDGRPPPDGRGRPDRPGPPEPQ